MVQETNMRVITEKERRIYYQNIVYDICNLVDRYNCKRNIRVCCGCVESPSNDLQKAVKEILIKISQAAQQAHEPDVFSGILEQIESVYTDVMVDCGDSDEAWRHVRFWFRDMIAAKKANMLSPKVGS